MAVDRLEIVGNGRDEDATASIEADLDVAKGTYVRSLAEELGRRVGVPAHLGALRRLACGELRVDDPLAVTGLRPIRLPEIEGRPPRWRIEAPFHAEESEVRSQTAKLLHERLAPPWLRLPFPASELHGDEPARLLDRLLHGQRLRLDSQTCQHLKLEASAASELHALVERAAGRMVIVRRDPQQHRIAPIRVLRFEPAPG
jgi:tRNA pseudouridine55 synthase